MRAMPERLFLIITLIVSEPPPHFHRFPAFSHSPAPKVRQRAGRVWKFCKKLFFFIFTRYNRGCFSNHRQNTGLPTGGNSFETYFHQGSLPCLRRRSGAEPRCLRRQGRQCCIQPGIFFPTRPPVRLRLPNFNYSDGLDEKGYWEGIRALDYVTLPEDFASSPSSARTSSPPARKWRSRSAIC